MERLRFCDNAAILIDFFVVGLMRQAELFYLSYLHKQYLSGDEGLFTGEADVG